MTYTDNNRNISIAISSRKFMFSLNHDFALCVHKSFFIVYFLVLFHAKLLELTNCGTDPILNINSRFNDSS